MKKVLLGIILLFAVLMLAGCMCKHEETKLVDTVAATCLDEGYSGNTFCLKCEKVVSKGEVTAALGHTEGELLGAFSPSCIHEGYTGDIYCTKCDELLMKGTSIPTVPHTQGGLVGAYAATCISEGHTGNVYCTVCNELLIEGVTIPALPHTKSELVNVVEATCFCEGYTGDIYCTVCNELLTKGTAISMIPHVEGEPVDVYEPTCMIYGYTGDIFCTVCDGLIKQGEAIEKLEHIPDDRSNMKESTCTSEGYTGDVHCINCDTIIEEGNSIPKLNHTLMNPYNIVEATCLKPGYSGDRKCEVCGEILEGSIVAIKDHNYSNNICTECEWRVPGLYVNDNLEILWSELINNGYVSVQNNQLTNIHEGLYGLLVVSEGIDSIPEWLFYKTGPDEVYLPSTITEIESETFIDSRIKRIRFFGDIQAIGYAAFKDCEQLEEVVIPEGITTIVEDTFYGCSSLKTVVLPSTLKVIERDAFCGCESLREILLPEGLESIGTQAFCAAGLTSVTVPASVTKMGMRALSSCKDLISADLSKCKVTELSQTFEYATSLQEVYLPETLIEGDSLFWGASSLEFLRIPHKVQSFGLGGNSTWQSNWCESLKSIIWPVGLTDASGFDAAVNLEVIYYEGSELQWNLVGGKKNYFGDFIFEGVEVVYDYEDNA